MTLRDGVVSFGSCRDEPDHAADFRFAIAAVMWKNRHREPKPERAAMNDATHIANLLYRYAELIDSGDLEGTAALFARAKVRMAGDTVIEGVEGMLAVWRSHVRIYPDGTPRTKHVVTNPIIEVDEAAGTATARSYYTVLQATPELPLQAICAGRYHDAFARDSVSQEWGGWHFTARDYSMLDMVGNMSAHMLVEVAGGA
jgi:3-phenylpropionate/cinnamic acid dioxygenase small subunit